MQGWNYLKTRSLVLVLVKHFRNLEYMGGRPFKSVLCNIVDATQEDLPSLIYRREQTHTPVLIKSSCATIIQMCIINTSDTVYRAGKWIPETLGVIFSGLHGNPLLCHIWPRLNRFLYYTIAWCSCSTFEKNTYI